jgi:hypothetical protein
MRFDQQMNVVSSYSLAKKVQCTLMFSLKAVP